MNSEIIKKISLQMQSELNEAQIQKLEDVLERVFVEEHIIPDVSKERKNLVKNFIAAKKIEGCSKRTEDYYLTTLIFFEKHIGCDICLARTNEIREYLINYQKLNNCSNVTLDNVRRILSSFYKWLEEEDYIQKSPMKRIHRIKAPVIIKPALTEEQIEVIRKSASDDKRNIAIVDFLLSSGIRVSELVRLNRSSINLNTRTCIVYGKGAKQRETYFDVRTKLELENYLKTRKDKNKALFITYRKKSKGGNFSRLSINSVETIIRELGKKSEIENVHPHRFRRTLATKAIDKGMPIEQVQVLLGHSKIDTTLRYANVQQSNVRYAHQRYICS